MIKARCCCVWLNLDLWYFMVQRTITVFESLVILSIFLFVVDLSKILMCNSHIFYCNHLESSTNCNLFRRPMWLSLLLLILHSGFLVCVLVCWKYLIAAQSKLDYYLMRSFYAYIANPSNIIGLNFSMWFLKVNWALDT